MFIEPVLKRDEINGKDISRKRVFDDFLKKNILIGDSKRQIRLLDFIENLRNHNDSGILRHGLRMLDDELPTVTNIYDHDCKFSDMNLKSDTKSILDGEIVLNS